MGRSECVYVCGRMGVSTRARVLEKEEWND